MPRKSKSAIQPQSAPVAEPQPKQIPKDLEDQVNAIRAIAQTYNLLQKGMYPYGFAPSIEESLKFLGALHSQALAQAKVHPDAALVPELAMAQQGAK